MTKLYKAFLVALAVVLAGVPLGYAALASYPGGVGVDGKLQIRSTLDVRDTTFGSWPGHALISPDSGALSVYDRYEWVRFMPTLTPDNTAGIEPEAGTFLVNSDVLSVFLGGTWREIPFDGGGGGCDEELDCAFFTNFFTSDLVEGEDVFGLYSLSLCNDDEFGAFLAVVSAVHTLDSPTSAGLYCPQSGTLEYELEDFTNPIYEVIPPEVLANWTCESPPCLRVYNADGYVEACPPEDEGEGES